MSTLSASCAALLLFGALVIWFYCGIKVAQLSVALLKSKNKPATPATAVVHDYTEEEDATRTEILDLIYEATGYISEMENILTNADNRAIAIRRARLLQGELVHTVNEIETKIETFPSNPTH